MAKLSTLTRAALQRAAFAQLLLLFALSEDLFTCRVMGHQHPTNAGDPKAKLCITSPPPVPVEIGRKMNSVP